MIKLRLLIEILIVLVVIAVACVFAFANETRILVDLLVHSIELNAGIAFLVAFGVGALFGFLVRIPSTLALKAKLIRTERKLKQASAGDAS